MPEILDQARRVGWLVAEAGLLVVVLCVLLNIILGAESSGEFVASVARNASTFLQSLPAGALMGLVLIVLAYWIVKPGLNR
jgi:ABC-type proline/glycine betaine transport system permease subunit